MADENITITLDFKGGKNAGGGAAGQNIGVNKEQAKINHQFKVWDKGNVGKLARMSQGQFSNLQQIILNPTGFMLKTMAKSAGKFISVLGILLIIWQVIS